MAESQISKSEYLAKKKLRSIKQRENNIGRAEKMHALRLKMEAAKSSDLFPKHLTAKALHIGCSGWFYWDWKEIFYPKQMPTREWFHYYTEHFDTVELNAPFYSWPTAATVKTWIRQAGQKDFVYTIKVCELITHINQFDGTKELIRDFGTIADMLGPKMGCFLFQLPPSYDYTPQRLKAITYQLDPARTNVVEFRHPSWWNKTVFNSFQKNNIIFCSCSAPKLPDDLVKTADDIYIRFHGTEKWYRHDYTPEELILWANKIQASGAKRIWIYFNNDYDGHAIKNANMLHELLINPS